MKHPQIKSKGDQEQRPASWEKHLKRVVSQNQRVSGTLCEEERSRTTRNEMCKCGVLDYLKYKAPFSPQKYVII